MSLINAQNSGWINDDGEQQTFWYTPLEWGEPPIYFAVRNDSLEAVTMLLSYGAKVTALTYLQVRSNQMEASFRSRDRPG
ncbi:hypothetical protein QIS74_13673 [Colletotrichum tabaci]|uniref:Ankyrin repeat protein n=1 Tax=Colletotrichum tabaci TaxID=1209068 RepID=A0AAV9SS29_9PEZI